MAGAAAHLLRNKSPLLVASNWEKLGANTANYSFANDADGNLVITTSGNASASGIFLKTSVLPIRADGIYFATVKFETWQDVTDQPRLGVGVRANSDPDIAMAVMARTVSNSMQIRGREVINGVIGSYGTNVSIGNNTATTFHDMLVTAAGTTIGASVVRTGLTDTPTDWSGTTAVVAAGQSGIAWSGAGAAGFTMTVSDFRIVA
jgi:hypothetical protein